MGNGTDRVQKELKFKQLYKQYYAPFCLYAKRYVNDISLCEDLISDVFTNLWNRIGDLELDSPAKGSTLSRNPTGCSTRPLRNCKRATGPSSPRPSWKERSRRKSRRSWT